MNEGNSAIIVVFDFPALYRHLRGKFDEIAYLCIFM